MQCAARDVPGLDRHPDLVRRFEYECQHVRNQCSGCARASVYRKYAQLVAERQPKALAIPRPLG